MKNLLLVAAACLAGAHSARAADSADSVELPPAVQSLLKCSDAIEAVRIQREMVAQLLELGGQATPDQEFFEIAGNCLDERLPPAVGEVRASPDLVDALKEYFTAAQSYRAGLADVSGGLAAFVDRATRAAGPHTAALQKVRMEALLAEAQESSE